MKLQSEKKAILRLCRRPKSDGSSERRELPERSNISSDRESLKISRGNVAIPDEILRRLVPRYSPERRPSRDCMVILHLANRSIET